MAEFGALTLLVQLVMHLAITWRLMIYRPGHGCRYKPGVSTLAAILAGSSAATAFNILARWPSLVHETSHPFTTLFVAVVLAGVLRSRGNLAYFITR